MAANGIKAADTLAAYRGISHGMCLFYVWQAYKANGAQGGIASGTALQGWYNSDGKHEGDRNPPAGVPVWFGAKPSSSAGDVVISLGNGRVVATDYPYYGVVGICTIDERQAQIGRPYLGWTETILGAEIDFPRGGSNPNPTNSGGSAATNTSWEDDMIALGIKDENGTIHYATLGLGVFRHLIQDDDPTRMKNIVTSDDQWTWIDIWELPRLLTTYGIEDTNIYRVDNGQFVVRNSKDGVVRAGGMYRQR